MNNEDRNLRTVKTQFTNIEDRNLRTTKTAIYGQRKRNLRTMKTHFALRKYILRYSTKALFSLRPRTGNYGVSLSAYAMWTLALRVFIKKKKKDAFIK